MVANEAMLVVSQVVTNVSEIEMMGHGWLMIEAAQKWHQSVMSHFAAAAPLNLRR